jgi:hypothetical protein
MCIQQDVSSVYYIRPSSILNSPRFHAYCYLPSFCLSRASLGLHFFLHSSFSMCIQQDVSSVRLILTDHGLDRIFWKGKGAFILGSTSPFKAIMIDRPGMGKVKNWRKSCAHCTFCLGHDPSRLAWPTEHPVGYTWLNHGFVDWVLFCIVGKMGRRSNGLSE